MKKESPFSSSLMRLGMALLLALGMLASLPVTAAHAATITVTNGNDSGAGSLRQAIADAASGDTINFAGDYTILLASELAITKDLTIDGETHSVTVSGNHVTRVFKVTAGTVVFNHLTIADGNVQTNDCGQSFDRCGGGLILQNNIGVNVTVTNSVFSGNGATFGGGIYNYHSTLTVANSVFSDNSTILGGGGIYNLMGALAVTNSAFSDNSAETIGGGIYSGGTHTATVTSSAFSGNNAKFGGGIGNTSTLTVANSTFSGNSATYGGGVYTGNGPLTVTNSTFSGNGADVVGGGILNLSGGTLNLKNNILANSTSGGDCYNSGATMGANINNLIETNGPDANACGTPALTDEPLLSALGDYGGSTRTFALLPGSPAIDAGDSVTCAADPVNSLDQRGVARPSACEIGAFESQGFTLTKTGGNGQSAKVNAAFTNPLALTVTANDAGVPVTGLVVAFNAPASGASAVLTGSPFTVGVDGIASVTATANGTVGGYNVTASASGAASVNFALTNLPDCASNITVTNNADSGAGSLRQAIADVCAGGTITFDNDYTILLGNELAIGKNLSVDGGTHSVTVSGNHVTRVFKVTAGTVVFNHLTIADGNAADCTGSIFATCGGGLMLQNNGVNVTVTNSTFSGNSTENAGGGIYNAGTLTVTNCAFSGNSVEYGTGAGIFNGVALTATVTNSVFSDNIATFGGGISNNGYLTVTNSAFSDNRAIYGGGIYNANFPLTVTNSTFSGNSATDGGGIYNSIGGTLHLNNNLLANATSGGDCYNTGTIGANINNLIETNGPGANACGTPSLTGDPLLSALGDYGGSTRTFALLPGSPAIDAGDSATCAAATVNSLDQRGVTRPSACDIGAFESQGFTLTKTGGDNQSTLVNTDFGAPLTLSVASAFGEPVNDGQVTFTVPASGASASIISSPGTISSGVVSVDASANGIVGGYNVTASASGANSADFALRNLGTPVITWANPSNIVYGTPLGATQLNATANVPGTFAYTPDTGEVLDVGTHTLHVDFVPTDAVNYTNTSKDVSITVMESTAPFVLSITRVDPNPTELDSLRFTVTFSESVTGVDEGDFILTATGKIDGEAIISVDGSGDTYTVTVSRGTGGGTLRLDVPDSAIITDQVGNSLTTPYESGEAYTILFKIYLPLYAHDTNVFLAPYKGPNP